MIRSVVEIQSLKGKRESTLVNPQVDGLTLSGFDRINLESFSEFTVTFDVNRDPDFLLYSLQWFQAAKNADYDLVVRGSGKQGDARRRMLLRFFNGEEGESCLKVEMPYACVTAWAIEHKASGEVQATFKFCTGPKKMSAQNDWDWTTSASLYSPTQFDENKLQVEQVGLTGFKKKFQVSLFKRFEEAFEVAPVHRRPSPDEPFRLDFIRSNQAVSSILSLLTENDCIENLGLTHLESKSKRNEAQKVQLSWIAGCGHLKSIDFRNALLSSVSPQTKEAHLGKFSLNFMPTETTVNASKELFRIEKSSAEAVLEIDKVVLRKEADFPEIWRACQSVFLGGIDSPIECVFLKPSIFPYNSVGLLTVSELTDVSFFISSAAIDSEKLSVSIFRELEDYFRLLVAKPDIALSITAHTVAETISSSTSEIKKVKNTTPKTREKVVLIGVELADASQVVGILHGVEVRTFGEKGKVSLGISAIGTSRP